MASRRINYYNGICNSDFDLNGLETEQREKLLRSDFRHNIEKRCGVRVLVRGRVIKPNEHIDKKIRPIHLLISGPNESCLKHARRMILNILGKDEDLEDEPFEEKITFGIDLFPQSFSVREHIFGNQKYAFIMNEWGAKMDLRGKGSNYPGDQNSHEPLHIHVKYYGNEEARLKAKELIMSLVYSVQNDFVKMHGKFYPVPRKPQVIPIGARKQPPRPATMKRSSTGSILNQGQNIGISSSSSSSTSRVLAHPSKRHSLPVIKSVSSATRVPNTLPGPSNQSISSQQTPASTSSITTLDQCMAPKPQPVNGSEEQRIIEKIFMGLREVPDDFNLKFRLYGEDVSNMKFILHKTEAVVVLQYSDDAEPFLGIRYLNLDKASEAKDLVFSLINTIRADFKEEYPNHPYPCEAIKTAPYIPEEDHPRYKKARMSINAAATTVKTETEMPTENRNNRNQTFQGSSSSTL